MYTLNIRIYVSWIKKKYIDIKRHIFIYIKRHISISGRTNIENQFHQFEATSSIQSHPIRGKQKFEMLTMQFPCCPSSATLENRILLHGSNQPGAVEQPAVLMLHFRIKKKPDPSGTFLCEVEYYECDICQRTCSHQNLGGFGLELQRTRNPYLIVSMLFCFAFGPLVHDFFHRHYASP